MSSVTQKGVRDFHDHNFEWPETIDRVCELVKESVAAAGKIRVRGSEHSDRDSVYTDGFKPMGDPPPSKKRRNLILDKLLGFEVNGSEIAVQTGHHLGPDPYAHGPARELANSLVHKLHVRGRALPALGGISHQSLAGFLSTGSAGGSTQHELSDSIAWIKLVDGLGEVKTIDRKHHDFDALLVGLGLCGIIVEVGFSTTNDVPEPLPEHFDVAMTSTITDIDKWTVKPFAKGELATFFRENEYARVLWWPQQNVNKVEVWTGKRRPHDPDRQAVPYRSFSPALQRIAHEVYDTILVNPTLKRVFRDPTASIADLQKALNTLSTEPSTAPTFAKLAPAFAAFAPESIEAPPDLEQGLLAIKNELTTNEQDPFSVKELFIANILKLFLEQQKRPTPHGENSLYGPWHFALPHDNQIDDNIIPVIFTEMWIELDRADEVMSTLRDLFRERELEATGTMCFEIYAAKRRTAWLSPSYGHDVLRVDPFVFWVDDHTRKEARENFFRLHWDALEKFNFRSHWGKELDGPSHEIVSYREKTFPRLREFREVRKRYDPQDIFLNEYWRGHLGI